MKKTFTLIVVLCSFILVSQGQVLLDETFNYSVAKLDLEPTWTSSGTAPAVGTGRNIATPALTYVTTDGTYVLSDQGKKINSDYTSGAADYICYKAFGSVNSGVVYLSFLYKAGVAQGQSQSEVIGLGDGASSGPKIMVGKGPTTGFRFGTTRGLTGSTDIKWGVTEYFDLTAVFLIVIKYDFTKLTSSIFINPTLGSSTQPAVNAADSVSGTGKTTLSTIRFRYNGNNKANFNLCGARVSSLWADAVAIVPPLPILSTPVVGAATFVSETGFTANWTSVANALSYDVKVYSGPTLISTTNASGQASESVAISGLSAFTTYDFKVTAKGDGVTYMDSPQSAASPNFTTSYTAVNTIHTNFNDGTWGTPVPAAPASGSFPSSSINGFIFEKAVIRAASKKDRRGDTHINDIAFDNVTNGGLVVFPVVNSVEQIELHAYTGTAERTFFLEEYNAITSTWDSIGTRLKYSTASKAYGFDSIYVIPISRSAPAKFRVRNYGGGAFNVAQIITRLTNPVSLPSPVVGVASNIISVGFTANWTTVDNATGYEVFVYKRGNFVSQTSAGGQATASQAIVGLVSDSTYTFKVRANGDGFVNYADSYVSLASAPFTITFPATATWTGAVSSDWSLTGNWNPSTPGAITDVTIPGGLTNYPTVTTARSCHNLTIQSGAAGTGSIIGNNLLTIGDTATVEHYIPGAASAWHFLSSPVTSQAISPAFTFPTSTEYDFFAWYEQTEEWVNFKSTSGTTWTMANGSTSFVAGKGYLVQYLAANPTKIFTGILNTGTINFPMTISGIGTFAKSNLAGNPYPSSIDWKSATGWDKSNLATLGSGYDYHVWNDAASQYGVYNDQNSVDIGTHNVSRYIAPMQGFFVTAAVAGNLTMNDNARVHSSQSWLKSGSNEGLRLKVTAPENKGSDEILIDLGHSSSLGGAAKWYSFVPTAPSLSIPKSGTEYSISFMETITNETVIPVSFKAGIDGQYTINANLQELPNAQVYLLDNKLVKTQNLSENPVYTFTASKNDDASRFVLHFGNVFGVNETANPQQVNIYASNNSVYVAVTKTGLAKGEVYVYNTLGQVMAHQYLSGDLTKINLVASSGYYLVKVITAESTYTGKVFVKQQ
jgi:hypothetical protein